jgi:hypothetical protein
MRQPSRANTLYFFPIFKELNSLPTIVSGQAPALLATGNWPLTTQVVEVNGIEPMTSCLQSRRSPN